MYASFVYFNLIKFDENFQIVNFYELRLLLKKTFVKSKPNLVIANFYFVIFRFLLKKL